MNSFNTIHEIRTELKTKLSEQEKREIEDASVETDSIHNITRREVRLANEEFHDAYFEGMGLLYEKMEGFENLLLSTEPQKWIKILDNAGKWVAIAIMFLLISLGCTGCTPF